jgi:hypothetical protein
MRAAALLALLIALAGCGGESAATLHNRAVAELRRGALVEAEIAAEKAAARGGAEVQPLADFVRGNAAFARCEQEELAAMGPRGVAGIDAALAHAGTAKNFWQLAAAGRPDWPAARRNVERARFKIDDLKKKRAELAPPKPPPPSPSPDPRPRDAQPRARPDDVTPVRTPPSLGELPPDQVLGVLDRLENKEEDKRRVRRAERKTRYVVEKDW